MVILDLHLMDRLLRPVTIITTTPRHAITVTQGGKSVVEQIREPVRTMDCGLDLFLGAQVSMTILLYIEL